MDSTAGNPGSGGDRYPAGSLLERWSESAWRDGLQLERLKDLQSFKVRTHNSLYEFIVISPEGGQVLLRGGLHFPHLTSVRLNGSTLGGSFLKTKGVYVGFCMEFSLGGLKVFTTSPVHWIGPVQDPGQVEPPAFLDF